uniref:Uncharacterized protein n=1 Tax=Glossina austeni TaxID=7395 RepID=A0A1A9VU95_GLOAU
MIIAGIMDRTERFFNLHTQGDRIIDVEFVNMKQPPYIVVSLKNTVTQEIKAVKFEVVLLAALALVFALTEGIITVENTEFNSNVSCSKRHEATNTAFTRSNVSKSYTERAVFVRSNGSIKFYSVNLDEQIQVAPQSHFLFKRLLSLL